MTARIKFDNYGEDEDNEAGPVPFTNVRGLTYHPNNEDDPHITLKDVSSTILENFRSGTPKPTRTSGRRWVLRSLRWAKRGRNRQVEALSESPTTVKAMAMITSEPIVLCDHKLCFGVLGFINVICYSLRSAGRLVVRRRS